MNAKDFIHRLKQIKAEILAFKQYKKIGVGRADFPRVVVSVPVPAEGDYTFKLTIEFENASVVPFMQFYPRYTYMPAPKGNYTFSDNIYINIYQARYGFAEDYDIAIIASAPIRTAKLEIV